MDAFRLLEMVRGEEMLGRALAYACRDRLRDSFYDPFEQDWIARRHPAVLAELRQELADIAAYRPRPAFSYLLPKNRYCSRYMIYVPIKDLAIRYALTAVLGDVLDHDLSPRCFANRRSRGRRAGSFLLQDFARTAWPAFCKWQHDCARRFPVMLRADVSAFYDSVCHEHLLGLLADVLGIPPEAPLLGLLASVLRVPVISYSRLLGRAGPARLRRQGLATGNNCDGFLANLYLREIDEGLSRLPDIAFGRYVDDLCIFGRSQKAVCRALAVLQEMLLERGLNLNAAKTAFAETPEVTVSLMAASPAYFPPEGEDAVFRFAGFPASELDQPFDRCGRSFLPDAFLRSDHEAKQYCRFMSGHERGGASLLDLSERLPAHVDTLAEILVKWPGASRHAAWLLYQSVAEEAVLAPTRQLAARRLFESLADENVPPYARYRLLHHLTKNRRTSRHTCGRFLDGLDRPAARRLIEELRPLLGSLAFELNIGALYAIGLVSRGIAAFPDDFVGDLPQPVAEPLQNILFGLRDGFRNSSADPIASFLENPPGEEEMEWDPY